MLRVIVRTTNAGDSLHVGGPVHESVKTFDISVEDLERFLRTEEPWVTRQVVGVELLPREKAEAFDG